MKNILEKIQPIIPKNREKMSELRGILCILDAATAIGISPHSFKFGEKDVCFAGLDCGEIREFIKIQRQKLFGLFE